MTSFGERLRSAVDARGRLCVGIDPHASLLAEWGLDASAAGVREFGLRVVEASAGAVGIVKPQVSFFEPYGSAGIAALEDVMRAARDAGLLVLADAKRGDIGSTMDAYGAAWLTPGSPLEADAMTVSPFLGVGALDGTFKIAERGGKGVFVLAATSNPDGRALQGAALSDGRTVSAGIVAEVSARNARTTPEGEWASLGFVVGATVDWQEAGLTAFAPPAPILAPGFGFQGADAGELDRRFGEAAPLVIASESRSILSAGPGGIAARVAERAEQYARVDV
ncbi:orotidine-5'-phosphate decarboxylase [Microbacterium terrae]|uniref:Orotidine-5'-phosphate decarboxylase n=1 Tax=Microbacterium terrae TaxID=69369 RepID=A0A0M2H2W3_9MICO|nr:orotidine-5'-phosphate decarboxylase [Microbacterium terrae]KJL37981.1 orotidine 5'-phosphate decarboxylase [Microbacterium terrae]MBP1077390.1 orotidine-5'-phosphate decarboxylase [Microbacterium terrae]GLJ99000.1 orotidine 5'-phosphate decarboxylase [Microbacterium terrae]